MAADLFETYVVTLGLTMVSIALLVPDAGKLFQLMALPLIVGGVCIITSIVGTYFVRLGKSQSIMGALYKGFWTTVLLSVPAIYLATSWILGGDMTSNLATSAMDLSGNLGAETAAGLANQLRFSGMDLFWCMMIGLAVTGLLVWITEYYTGTNYRPVQSIAKASETGHGTNVIQGLAISLESTALPTIVIVVAVIATYQLAGIIGVAFAATALLALAGMVVALDAYGPVTDNAGGIAEMAGLPDDVRHRTDALDAVGNTTKAVTKGYAIGSAALAALVLFGAYTTDLDRYAVQLGLTVVPGQPVVNFSLSNPYVIVGLLLGALLPYLFGAFGMTAVGRAAGHVVEDVRAQFRDNPGIMAGTSTSQLRPHRRHRDQGRDPRDDHPLAAPGRQPGRRLLHHRRGGRQGGRLRVARRDAARRHRLRPVRRDFHDERRRRLGQCQEVHRGRQPRRQG